MVVDLTGASFIDSSILRALIVARNGSQDRRLGFAVCLDQNEDSAVKRVFEIARAQELFPVLSTQTEAVDAVLSAATDRHEPGASSADGSRTRLNIWP